MVGSGRPRCLVGAAAFFLRIDNKAFYGHKGQTQNGS
jgi:hypothetical protein